MSDAEQLRVWLRAKPNQKILLVQAEDKEDFKTAFAAIRSHCVFPIEGSIWECPCMVGVSGHEKHFFAISINGNLSAWEIGVRSMCLQSNREIAEMIGDEIRFDSGEKLSVREIDVFP